MIPLSLYRSFLFLFIFLTPAESALFLHYSETRKWIYYWRTRRSCKTGTKTVISRAEGSKWGSKIIFVEYGLNCAFYWQINENIKKQHLFCRHTVVVFWYRLVFTWYWSILNFTTKCPKKVNIRCDSSSALGSAPSHVALITTSATTTLKNILDKFLI